MYKVKPIAQENMSIQNTANSMYPVRAYVASSTPLADNGQPPKLTNGKAEPVEQQTIAEQEALVELSKQQDAQLRRLDRLQKQVDAVRSNFHPNHFNSGGSIPEPTQETTQNKKQHQATKQVVAFANHPLIAQLLTNRATTKTNKNEIVQDFVIQCDPEQQQRLSSLLLMIHILSQKFKCFVEFFAHCSVASEGASNVSSIQNLVRALKLDLHDSRTSYDYGFTFLWKKNDFDEPLMTLGLAGRPPLCGVATLLRLLSRLLRHENNVYENLDVKSVALVDNWIDKCTNSLLLQQQDEVAFLDELNAYLAKRKSLSGIADFYVWSFVHAKKKSHKNVKEWCERLEKAFPLLKLLKELN